MQRGRIGLAALMVVAFVPTVTAQIQIEPAFSNLSFTSPVDLQDPGDGTNRLFVVEQAGVIRVFENDAAVASAPITGRLWTGDVGQGEYEEVDVIQPGRNYGWNTMEGFHCFDPPMGCDQTSLNLPVWEYPHDGQGRSVTGGYVYRGPSVQALLGQYVYADFIDGRIWALAYDGTTATNTLLLDTNLNIAAFGVDAAGELYLCAFDGAIYRFTPVVSFAITLKKLIRTANNTKKVKIRWDPAEVSTNKIDFYVDEVPDGTYLKRTFDDGNHKLKLKTSRFPGDGPFSIQACEKNSTTACSNILTADFVGVSIDLDEPEDDPEDDETLLREDALADVLFKAEAYPNPFNPSTTIRFTLREATPVRLEVFDVIGRRVAVLIDRSLEAGDHDAVFEAGPLPGGVYLYRIQAGNTISLGRMTLLR